MVDKSPRRVREMFDRISPTYDFLNHLLSLNVDIAWRRRAADFCSGRVLDLCCGTGDLALEIASRRASPVGADFAMRMLSIARAKSRRRLPFVQADALRIPFRDASFDACTVAFGLRNLADPARGIAEMARVVRPGGKVVVLEFTLPAPGLFRRAYLAYFNHVLPRIGAFIARDRAYRYLNESVRDWMGPEDVSRLMRGAGLGAVEVVPLTLGIAAIHAGTRPIG